MNKKDKIYIAGHTGLVGSALARKLKVKGFQNLILAARGKLDLEDGSAVDKFFIKQKPDYVFLVAGKVGGIKANIDSPVEYLNENLKIQMNVINSSWKSGVKKLLNLGCSCLYPRNAKQPIKEEYLLTGPFETTNESFSVAKLAGYKLCQAYRKEYKSNFIYCVADTLYGPNDSFDLEKTHVLPSLIKRFHIAKVNHLPGVEIWGSGKPVRGFVYVDDLADACLFLMEKYNGAELINISSGENISIKKLAYLIKKITGYKGKVKFDITKPDGMKKKSLDKSKIFSLGWKPEIKIEAGIRETYDWCLKNPSLF